MYAVFAAGGKQHRVEVGTLIDVEKIEASVGEEITFSGSPGNRRRRWRDPSGATSCPKQRGRW